MNDKEPIIEDNELSPEVLKELKNLSPEALDELSNGKGDDE